MNKSELKVWTAIHILIIIAMVFYGFFFKEWLWFIAVLVVGGRFLYFLIREGKGKNKNKNPEGFKELLKNLIIMEGIYLAILLIFFREIWVVACDTTKYGFFNPFMNHFPNCALPAFKPIFNPMIYLFTDFIVMTLVVYLWYLLIEKIKRNRHPI